MIAHCSLKWSSERIKAGDYATIQEVREKDPNSSTLVSKRGNVSAFLRELGHHVVMVTALDVKWVNTFI